MAYPKFKIERNNESDDVLATIFEVSDIETFAGSIKIKKYNNGRPLQLVPCDRNGQPINTYEKDVEQLIELVERVYINAVELDEVIDKEWEDFKSLAKDYKVSEDSFKQYGNVRNYLNNIRYCTDLLNKHRETKTQLMAFRDSIGFTVNLPAVQDTIINKIEELEIEIDRLERDREQFKEWLGKY